MLQNYCKLYILILSDKKRGWGFVDEGGETFFFSVDFFQITSES